MAEAALPQTIARLGRRVYATNCPAAAVALAGGVLCYRDEYRIEQSFRRLKGVLLSVSPFYLQRDDHAKAWCGC